ncbi:MAG TPA: hypothetical protein VNN80_00490, partial [Polyangiaceae bacterium]|nr:hypothetical protein [Polyangiaceae bacterium]
MGGAKIYTEQIRTLYRQTETVLLANCIAGTILGTLLWSSASRVALAAWLAALASVAAVRWRL